MEATVRRTRGWMLASLGGPVRLLFTIGMDMYAAAQDCLAGAPVDC